MIEDFVVQILAVVFTIAGFILGHLWAVERGKEKKINERLSDLEKGQRIIIKTLEEEIEK